MMQVIVTYQAIYVYSSIQNLSELPGWHLRQHGLLQVTQIALNPIPDRLFARC